MFWERLVTSNGGRIHDHAIKWVVVQFLWNYIQNAFGRKETWLRSKGTILSDIFRVIYVLEIIYQVGKKQYSQSENSCRKQNDCGSGYFVVVQCVLMLRDHWNKWKQKYTSFWWKPLRTNHKWPHSSTLIVFLHENKLFQRGWGVFVTLVEIPRGWGVISSLQKWKIQGGGGVLSEIPSEVGVWIFSGTTHSGRPARSH